MAYHVNAVFDDREEAAKGIALLQQNAFSSQELTVVARAEDEALAESKASAAGANRHASAWAGTALGAAVGGYLGLLSIALIPALPLFVVGGAALGGFVGSLTGLGVADQQVKDTEQVLHRGGVLVVVKEEDRNRAELAKRLLEQTHARDVTSAEAWD